MVLIGNISARSGDHRKRKKKLFHRHQPESATRRSVMISTLRLFPDVNLKPMACNRQARVRLAAQDDGPGGTMRVLFIEDDTNLGEAVRDHIVGEGHAVDWVRRLGDAEAAVASVSFDLLLLDLGLPDGRGLDFLKHLREAGNSVPVVIVTAMDQISWRIEGLNAGADDYLVKPFDLSELSARLAAVARRYSGNPNPLIAIGDLSIDLVHRLAARSGVAADLTGREWAVLERLVRRPGAIVSKAELEDTIYAFGAEIESNAVEVYVSRLRRKLGADAITTVRGVGYRVGDK
jgi:two-component system OmpR family response regulator